MNAYMTWSDHRRVILSLDVVSRTVVHNPKCVSPGSLVNWELIQNWSGTPSEGYFPRNRTTKPTWRLSIRRNVERAIEMVNARPRRGSSIATVAAAQIAGTGLARKFPPIYRSKLAT